MPAHAASVERVVHLFAGDAARLVVLVRVDRFHSSNFRNLGPDPVEFDPGLNLLIGANGQGKTNLLEAIYYFRLGRSFRAQNEAELIRFGEALCRVELACSFEDGHRETFAAAIERRDSQTARTIKLDGRAVSRRSDLAGRFPAVLFGPSDLRIVSGEPEHRRRFLDMVGTMTDPAYLRVARDYRRILEQRNAALKSRASGEEMGAWDERLVASGLELLEKRRGLASRLEERMGAHARDIAIPFELSLRYESVLLGDGEADGEDAAGSLDRVFHERLAAAASEERRRGVTLVGPHRDELGLRMSGRDLRRFGSQGQRRLFAVLLKMAELAHLEAELREPCVLLLDDVFSEFDPGTIARLRGLLRGERQVFVTGPVELEPARSGRGRVYRVHDGRVTAGEPGTGPC